MSKIEEKKEVNSPMISEIPELKKIWDAWMIEANNIFAKYENLDVSKCEEGEFFVSNKLKELQDIYAPKIQAEWERVKGNYKEVDGKFVPKDEK